MLAILAPETGDANVPVTVFPVFFGPGQLSSSVSWDKYEPIDYDSVHSQIGLVCPLVSLG